MRKTILFISGIFLVIIVLVVAQISVANMLSTDGITLHEVQSAVDSYQKENTILRASVLTRGSLTNIASEAAQLGFVEDKSQLVISAPIPLAIKP